MSHTVPIPEELLARPGDMLTMLGLAYVEVFDVAGYECMSVHMILGPKAVTASIAVIDPHNHLQSPIGRDRLRQAINRSCSPRSRRFITETLLGPDEPYYKL